MTDILDDLSLHLENVRRRVEPLYEQSDLVAGMIRRSSEAEDVGRYLYRIPFRRYPGGSFGKISLNAASMGVGHSHSHKHLTAAYFPARLAFRMTQEQLRVTDGNRRAVLNSFNELIRDAVPTMQVMDDITLHTDGTGVLTNGSSDSAANSLTFAGASDTLGTNRLREGMAVDVVAATLAGPARSPATARPLIIQAINHETKVVTFNQNVTGITTGDVITIEGLFSGGGPDPLSSFNAGWPTAPESQVAAGIGGDSFRHGIYYVNDGTDANYFLGIQKSAIPQLRPATINAQSDALTFAHGYELFAKIQRRFDGPNKNSLNGLVGLAEFAQRRAVQEIGVSISNAEVTGPQFGESKDMWPSNLAWADRFNYCGVPCRVDKRQFTDRFDFINPSQWFRAVAINLEWFGDMQGKRFFEVRTSDAVASGWDFYLYNAMDWGTGNPGAGGFISSLAVPTI